MKKIAVLLPVFILAISYFRGRFYGESAIAGFRGKASLAFALGIMFLVMIIAAYNKTQETFLKGFVQASFLVYVFVVLTLTGYFILFREVTAHGWWQRVVSRIQTREKINLEPFLMFKQFQLASTQVIGNMVMLLPLGIYVPLLFANHGFFKVFFICLLASVLIELMQLVTNVRSTDIDDVILNTSGAVTGYMLYKLFQLADRNQHQ